MLGRKCSLCGGDLDRNNICTECGLDNSKSDRNYKINQSSCDGQPLTHVHDKPESYARPVRNETQKKYRQPRNSWEDTSGRHRVKRMVIILIVLVAFGMAGVLKDVFWNIAYRVESEIGGSEETYEYEPGDPYEYVERELSEEGETAEYALESGEYIVGVHIPEGRYTAEVQDDFDAVHVSDYQNVIYLYEYAGKEEECYLDDLRLYEGARVTIDADNENTVTLYTENAQLQTMHGMENPVTESVRISSGRTWRAGEDFDAGVYDLKLTGGSGSVSLTVYNEEGEDFEGRFFYLSENGSNVYRNLVIPKNSEINFDEGDSVRFTLTPSETIGSVNYLEYYHNY